jgi:GntR family transcriptional regulator, vanillate catabolism transcriptional regulator
MVPINTLSATTPALSSSGTHDSSVQQRLREMILTGLLPGGARLTEQALVSRLGVSRTPIRAALIRLEEEGLLQQLGNGGFAVRLFSEAEVADAIELRGCVEGLAARLAAERGVSKNHLEEGAQCLAAIDLVLAKSVLNERDFSSYVELNAQFHVWLGHLAGSSVVARELARVCSLPFASPSGFVGVQSNSPQARDMLVIAQDQHRQVVQAIVKREGARAESIMREHCQLAQRNLKQAVFHPPALMGGHLIRIVKA